MQFDIVTFSGIGGKKVNEDSVRVNQSGDDIVAVLADGLGSHGGGDIASGIVAETFAEGLLDCTDDTMINTLFSKANNSVIAKQTPGTEMKSTLVVFKIQGSQTTFIHAGDSRGYLFRNNKVFFQTFDHSLPQMEVLRGNIKQEDIRFHPNRNKVLRALGIEGVYPEISGVQKVCIGDAFLLCSDGFWEFITENEMLIDLSKSRNAEEWVSFMLWRVGSRIQAGTDNLSAVAMIINQ